jgi:hypothetical protein
MPKAGPTSNLPQINPVAPMALDVTRFVTHDKTSYPFKPEYPGIRRKPRCIKVLLNSTDRRQDSTLTSAKFNVSLPTTFLAKRLNLVVDSFIVAANPNPVINLHLFPYYIRIAEFKNTLSYSSATQTTSGNILLTTGTTYQNNAPRDSGGSTMVDVTLFQRPITIEFHSPHFNIAAAIGLANDWSICLSLWDEGIDD